MRALHIARIAATLAAASMRLRWILRQRLYLLLAWLRIQSAAAPAIVGLRIHLPICFFLDGRYTAALTFDRGRCWISLRSNDPHAAGWLRLPCGPRIRITGATRSVARMPTGCRLNAWTPLPIAMHHTNEGIDHPPAFGLRRKVNLDITESCEIPDLYSRRGADMLPRTGSLKPTHAHNKASQVTDRSKRRLRQRRTEASDEFSD